MQFTKPCIYPFETVHTFISITFQNASIGQYRMKIFKQYSNLAIFSMLFMLTIFAAGCGSSDDSAATPDTNTPTVISTNPVDGATGVSLNTSITAFSGKALNGSSVNDTTFTLKNGTAAVAGTVTYEGNTMLFNPTNDFTASTKYTATVTTGVLDTSGAALLKTDLIWSFTTGTELDSTPPTVDSTYPDSNDTNVSIDRSVSAHFSEALDPTTVTSTTFTLADANGSTLVPGTVINSGDTMIFNSSADLLKSTEYTATITTGVTDLAGNALANEYTWNFTTGTTVGSTRLPIDLGTAGNYVILAKTAVSTTGTTDITGDIGVSPAARTFITGFSDTLFSDGTYSTSNLVTGKIYAADMAVPTPTNLTTAVSNMETAYTDAAGRTLPDYTELGAGDVSGKTLAPGLYKWGTGLLITNAGVTISGSATDVWIFQIAGDLTVNNGAIVTLAGGALAKNIFWQVAGGTGVTLGTTAQFKGVVLAQKAIAVNTGATVNGRLLAQTAVTLDANAVTQPAN
jgi:hypothetical protein